MLTISKKIISIIPVEKGKINQPAQKEKSKLKEDLLKPGYQNYSITPNLPIYTTNLEIDNKGRIILVKRRE